MDGEIHLQKTAAKALYFDSQEKKPHFSRDIFKHKRAVIEGLTSQQHSIAFSKGFFAFFAPKKFYKYEVEGKKVVYLNINSLIKRLKLTEEEAAELKNGGNLNLILVKKVAELQVLDQAHHIIEYSYAQAKEDRPSPENFSREAAQFLQQCKNLNDQQKKYLAQAAQVKTQFFWDVARELKKWAASPSHALPQLDTGDLSLDAGDQVIGSKEAIDEKPNLSPKASHLSAKDSPITQLTGDKPLKKEKTASKKHLSVDLASLLQQKEKKGGKGKERLSLDLSSSLPHNQKPLLPLPPLPSGMHQKTANEAPADKEPSLSPYIKAILTLPKLTEEELNLVLTDGEKYDERYDALENLEIDVADPQIHRALHHLVETGDDTLFEDLLKAGVDVSLPDAQGNSIFDKMSPLLWASFKRLVKNGEIPNKEAFSQLIIDDILAMPKGMETQENAAETRKKLHERIETFLELGIQPDPSQLKSAQALHHAVDMGDETLLYLLLDRGFDFTAIHEGNSLTDKILRCENENVPLIFSDFLSRQLKVKDPEGNTWLHRALAKGSPSDSDQPSVLEMIPFLKSEAALFNQQNHRGQTALHLAAKQRQYEAMRFLLEKEVDLHLTDREGNTPLHLLILSLKDKTIQEEDREMIRLLVEKKSDVDKANQEGKTARELAGKIWIEPSRGQTGRTQLSSLLTRIAKS